MLEPIPDLPGNVAGFTARGKVTGEDYEKVLIPIIEEKLEDHSKIRLLYHLDEGVTGMDAAAMWDDAKVGIKHLSSWEKIAIVTDIDWIRNAVRLFGFAMPGPVKTFRNRDLPKAVDWITA
jgi:hypothetical protein